MTPESLVLLVLLGGMLLLMVNRTRKQQREAQELQARVSVGARVMTTAGLHATVVEIDDDTVTLETAPGQHSRWDRRAVARILPVDDDVADEDEDEDDAEVDATDVDDTDTTRTPDVVPEADPVDVRSKDAAPPERA